MMRLAALLSLIAALAFTAPALAQSEPRLALLIGNQDYPGDPPRLRRPHDDAATLGAALERAEFEVVRVLDADAGEIEDAVAAFGERLREAGPSAVGFFYYAGHGAVANAQGARRNFILPAGVEISSATAVAQRGVRLDRQIDALESAGAATLFVVYDACRNSFSRGNRGFTVETPRPGILVAMSTMADATTPDDGAYAVALANEITRPGQPALLAFSRASQLVGRGRPSDELPTVSPALREEFCFISCNGVAASSNDPAAPPAFEPHSRPNYDGAPVIGQSEVDGAEIRSGALIGSSVPPGVIFTDAIDFQYRGPEMVILPAGSFRMGTPDDESGRRDDEGPVRDVTIAHPFAVSRFEVTIGDWDTCARLGGCTGNPAPDNLGRGRGHRPVVNVSWEDAQQYIAWLSGQTRQPYRLLSEAEWEYAARAGTTTRYFWGDELPSCSFDAANGANVGGCSRDRARTTDVGSFAPNGFGLFDMHGNAYEWVHDCVGDYEDAPDDGTAVLAGRCEYRRKRGGASSENAVNARSGARSSGDRAGRFRWNGFRVARDLD